MTVKSILDDKGYDVSAISADETLEAAAQFLAKKGIGAVIISKPEEEIAGILSERDIVRAVAKDGPSALAASVSAYMTENVKTSGASNSILEVMEQMTSGGFRHLPIVEDGHLLGIISIRDVIKHRMDEVQRESEHIKAYIAAG